VAPSAQIYARLFWLRDFDRVASISFGRQGLIAEGDISASFIAVVTAALVALVLADPITAAVFLFVVFVPVLLVGRWQLRKPPHPPEQPD
jgi:hypothetical protein